MKASETSLRNLLEGGKQFQIPLFQRPYAWEKKHWTTLWEDLMSLYYGEVEGSYFLGSIVTQAIPGTADGISPYILIDGQQRLITLSILLGTLRNYFLQSDDKMFADELYENYLINKFKQGDDFYKVLPTQDDREAYQSIIKAEDESALGKISQICKAYKFFKTQITKFHQDEKVSINLIELKKIILERLFLVNITSDERDNPYLIFESLNHKGQALTQADLVRNYIFMKLPNKERQKVYNNTWLPFQESFKTSVKGDKYVEELTKAFWFYSRKDGKKVNENGVYKEIKRKFDESLHGVKYELAELMKFTDYYQRMNFDSREPEPRLSKCFKRLIRLKFNSCHVFLLNIYDDYQIGRISLEDFERILLYLESYFVRRLFANISTQNLGDLFINIYHEVKKLNFENLADGVHHILVNHQSNKRFPNDDEFRKGIVNRNIYDTNQTDRVKFILERLEGYLCIEEVDSKNITIEHIMPQKLNDDWKKMLGENSEFSHSRSVHILGNLTLTGCNSTLSNKPFKLKKDIYEKSNLSLNQYFKERQIDQWDEVNVKERAEFLADIAIQVWSR